MRTIMSNKFDAAENDRMRWVFVVEVHHKLLKFDRAFKLMKVLVNPNR